MKTYTRIAILLLASAAGLVRADEVSDLLKAADLFRIGTENMQVETEITTYAKDGSKEKERNYLVFSQTNHQSLVLMKSPAEKGQKVLMLGDDFWMLLPGSQRPLRITPMQKLLGDASIGDIATMSWAQDYTGKIIGEEKCNDKPCLHLSLNAVRKSVAYQRIELWLGKTRHEPVKADLYVQSEKLAKQASFILDKPQAPTAVAEMLLLDQLSSHKETRVRYISRKQKTVPEQWLNPMFLAKNPSLE
ncbi:outer membrane lipoprotein-sorting protein [Undibacterium sp. CY18W]|uniref:Outer membrane lipoprotein-sorting protein n=1 Tax=Undibacterium hunanense TaxID=2762292 RepID=A0ABR6ZSA1_9BURK|nr:outer membrane lipoprotein-sorting protein [Undibacterium hunanense]MBC3918739.1 outer membrane lipoprotein-sorting protein [Undibacterium hunanense]